MKLKMVIIGGAQQTHDPKIPSFASNSICAVSLLPPNDIYI